MKLNTVWRCTLECVFIAMLGVAAYSVTTDNALDVFVSLIWVFVLPFVLPLVYNVSVIVSDTIRLYLIKPTPTIKPLEFGDFQPIGDGVVKDVRYVRHNVMGRERPPIELIGR